MLTKIIKAAGIVLSILAVLLLAGFLFGCGVSKKNSSTESFKKDTTGQSATVHESEKSNEQSYGTTESNTNSEERRSIDDYDVKVTFTKPIDTTKKLTPIVIKRNEDGSVSVDPGGRDTKDVTTSQSKTAAVKTTQTTTKQDSGRTVQKEKVRDTTGSQATVHSEGKKGSSSSFSWKLPAWVWIIGIPSVIVAAFLIWYFRLYKRKPDRNGSTVPYSAPGDKTA